jgi:hypothetical protein
MFDRPAMWMRLGATFLVVSFVAALLQPNGETVYGNRTVFILDAWIERTAFWLGMVFVAGYILDRVFARHRDS